MKRLSTTPITNSAQFFPKKGTLEFLQLQHRETTAATIIALIGPAYSISTMYVLYGVVNTGTYPTYTVSTGAVFHNGEIYYIDAASFTATGSDVAVFSSVQTQYAIDADPCTFSDATTHNIHNIVKMQLTVGSSGSGLADLTQAFYMNFVIPSQLQLTAPVTSPYVGNQLQIIGAYPNLIGFVPPASNLNPVLFAGSYNIGNIAGSDYNDFSVTFVALSTASYYVVGTIISNGTPSYDTVVFNIRNRTTTGFTLGVRVLSAVGGLTQNIAFEYIIFAK